MKIAIGSDHAGFERKEEVRKYLIEKGIDVSDKGTYSEERADYPDFGHAVAMAVGNKEVDFGIILCGSGNGINMAANKHKGIRSALCWNEEIAALARQHNDANIMALPARFITKETAVKCADAFLNNSFEGGRHADRISKIDC
ncbi:MAG: ribose 5-phosphate isomerase [Bacteroidetes bacterium]|jgi:ribose 5-phosphate isomerase B|nr:ribose 5-phosphate isomerase [Bacteroidota bacterium]